MYGQFSTYDVPAAPVRTLPGTPICVATCPSGAIYKREEDGIVLRRNQAGDKCRGWRLHCISGCPYKKYLLTGRAASHNAYFAIRVLNPAS